MSDQFSPFDLACAVLSILPRRARGSQILYIERVLAEASEVYAVGQQIAVVAVRCFAYAYELMFFGHLIGIKYDLLGRIHRTLSAAADRVLLAFLYTRIVEIAAAPYWNIKIGLLNAAKHLLIQLVSKGLSWEVIACV